MQTADDSVPDDRAAFAPLITRVLDLGRGPPALVRWVSARVARGQCAAEATRLLGRVLVRAMRTRAGGAPETETTDASPGAPARATCR